MSADPVLLVEHREAVAWLTMNRPRSANALDAALHAAIVGALGAADADPAVRGVVLRGQGGRVFSAGADLKEFSDLPHETAGPMRRDLLGRTLLAMTDFGKPLVCCVNGKAVGAGCMLALLGDEVYGDPATGFSLPEIRLGSPTPVGAAIVASRGPRRATQRLVQAGESLDSQDALASALLDGLLGSDAQLEAACQARALALGVHAPDAYRRNKQWMNAALRSDIVAALDLSARLQAEATSKE
ncbi:MAG: enoyl-CoA hydratase/isomerase family protein [Lautropia sp.]